MLEPRAAPMYHRCAMRRLLVALPLIATAGLALAPARAYAHEAPARVANAGASPADVHSTHRLGDDRGAARCTVASTASMIIVTEEDPQAPTVMLAPAPVRPSEAPEKDPAVCPLPISPGRVPPLPR